MNTEVHWDNEYFSSKADKDRRQQKWTTTGAWTPTAGWHIRTSIQRLLLWILFLESDKVYTIHPVLGDPQQKSNQTLNTHTADDDDDDLERLEADVNITDRSQEFFFPFTYLTLLPLTTECLGLGHCDDNRKLHSKCHEQKYRRNNLGAKGQGQTFKMFSLLAEGRSFDCFRCNNFPANRVKDAK